MSRLISDLIPELQPLATQFIADCKSAGYDVIIVQTLRTFAEQDALYAQGRNDQGQVVNWRKVVTHARGGYSWHNYGRAFDAVPLKPGDPTVVWWDAPQSVWSQLGAIGENLGLTWGGRWAEPKTDLDQWELTDGMTIEEALAQYQQQQEGEQA